MAETRISNSRHVVRIDSVESKTIPRFRAEVGENVLRHKKSRIGKFIAAFPRFYG